MGFVPFVFFLGVCAAIVICMNSSGSVCAVHGRGMLTVVFGGCCMSVGGVGFCVLPVYVGGLVVHRFGLGFVFCV